MSGAPNDPVADSIAAAVPVDNKGELNPYADQDCTARVGVKNGCLCAIDAVKTEKGFEKSYRVLLNGIVYIDEIQTHDDGETTTDYMLIKGRTEKGEELPPVRIPAKQFRGLDWLFEHYSKWLNVVPGPANKDVLRFLIREISQGMKKPTVYTHTGFREINGQLRFLTASGGLGIDGLDRTINVKLPGNSAYYNLPEPTGDPADIVGNALHLLSIAPECKGLGAALFSMVFCVPLTDTAQLTFVLGLFGESGSAKSSVFGLIQSFFGAGFYQAFQPNFPANFSDTGLAIAGKLNRGKNVIAVIDEFTLNGSAVDANRIQDKLKEIAFSVDNSMGREKCAPDSTTIPAQPPKEVCWCRRKPAQRPIYPSPDAGYRNQTGRHRFKQKHTLERLTGLSQKWPLCHDYGLLYPVAYWPLRLYQANRHQAADGIAVMGYRKRFCPFPPTSRRHFRFALLRG